MLDLNHRIGLDFTGTIPNFKHFPTFSKEVATWLKNQSHQQPLVVVDYGWSFIKPTPHIVRDHINLAGANPLVGPCPQRQERFPSLSQIYVIDDSLKLPSGIVAGIKSGVTLSAQELDLIKSLGADFYCYNLVPTTLIAAQYHHKVLGIIIPESRNAGYRPPVP